MPLLTDIPFDDPRLGPYRNLKDHELARDGDRFLAEGLYIVQRLLASDHPVDSLLVARRRLPEIVHLLHARPEAPVYVLDDPALSRIVGFKFHTGVLAVGRRPPPTSIQQLLLRLPDLSALGPRSSSVLLVCPKVINTDNLGSILRIAAALGALGLLLGPRSCDPYFRRCVRVSMGAVFHLPIHRSDDLKRDLDLLTRLHRFTTLATVVDPDATPLHRFTPTPQNESPTLDGTPSCGGVAPPRSSAPPSPPRFALLLGPEDTGLEPFWVELCHHRLTIPMHQGMDSLNIATAAAVFLHHLLHLPPSRER